MTGAPAVLVMAKAPRPGMAKTRLAPLLGHSRCASLQELLIRRTCELACSVAPAAAFVAFHPADALTELAGHVPPEATLFPQKGAHLGERLMDATRHVLGPESRPLVVIGTDIPLLSTSHLHAAIGALESGTDVVLGPAEDGGYYLVGLPRARPTLFGLEQSLWGGPSVLDETVKRAQAAGLSVRLLDPLRDLDTPADAEALLADPELPADVRRLLAPESTGIEIGADA